MSDASAPTAARSPVPPAGLSLSRTLLSASAKLWFLAAATGQWMFVYYITLAYLPVTVAGDYASWDDTGLMEGYTQGDAWGNLAFISHVLLAAVITAGGLLQLTPALRKRFPALHRWTGRTYMLIAVFMALGGIGLIWIRGTRVNDVAALGTTMDAILILVAAGFALRHAMARQINSHRRWAMRLFIFVSGVWFTRIGYMGWAMLTGGAGMSRDLTGWFDSFIAWGSFLIPWILLELYMRAQDSRSSAVKFAMSGVVLLAAAFTALGVFGAWMMMWSPHI
ncbi:DUF2306 domain-containing protein [Maricaulis parjimensis]|uniref:DUF2306 domain-containing protein n=1 Tax=Maricaulis parjimensis TaxID=144023 RepID=UPI00193A59D8|nr:DUF2306 domain-containing protein [Maricaulis parjimensis]